MDASNRPMPTLTKPQASPDGAKEKSSPGKTSRQSAARPDAEMLRSWLRDMLLIREFEVRCMQAYQNKKIGGFCHVYIGQEAVAVGTTAAVNPDDPIVTAYRDHGHALPHKHAEKVADKAGRDVPHVCCKA